MKKLKKLLSVFTASCILAGTLLSQGITAFAGQQLGQLNFDDGVGLPWHICESGTGKMDFEIDNGVYGITIVEPGGVNKGGEDRWDCQFRHRGLKIVSGHTYEVSYEITATNSGQYYTKIGNLEGTVEAWHGNQTEGEYNNWALRQLTANQTEKFNCTFTAKESIDVAEWAFHLGGSGKYTPSDCFPAGTVVTFDNMSLTDTTSDENDYVAPEKYERNGILLNQLGYYQGKSKKATLLSSSSSAVDFDICDSSGNSVYSGKSEPFGKDKDSNDDVHILDFSDFDEVGTGYYIKADDAQSYSFDITDCNLYSDMLYDSLKYFYNNRSGIEIEEKYVGDAMWARAAGHNPDSATTEVISDGSWAYSETHTLDVTGGWYDAGDHGKYIVNGGIAVWTMQNQYERTLDKDKDFSAMYADGTMNIPESGNGYPDILDEARYEIEFMLKMIVPDGDKYAGMVYHKVHDEKWTGLAVAPADDDEPRIIKPPTTAATLNVSAVCAQAYRLWKDLDSTFADQCLEAAKTTYEAALANPERYAPLDEKVGGGAYGDDNVTDEFYWAACELYISTGDDEYMSNMKDSDHYLECSTTLKGGEDSDTVGSMNWGNTAALGTLSLVTAPNDLSSSDLETAKSNIVSASEYYLGLEDEQGYGVPIAQCSLYEVDIDGGYPWGSNSFVVNNAIVMAYAYDITGDEKHLDGITEAMDYIMGRNANDYSYVTGYGEHAAQNPHHRYWSNQVDEAFPTAPAGVLVGGPNSGMQDPWVRGSGWKLGEISPQKCYLDHIEAWSTNECTINWNTPLAWVTGYLTESNAENVDDIKIGGTMGMGNVGDVKIDDSSNDSSSKDTEKVVSANKTKTTDDDDDNNSSSGNNKLLYIIIIAAAALAIVISIEVFVYKLIKAKSAGNITNQGKDSNDSNK